MLSQKIQDALNDQINAETYSAYLYLSMAMHSESINLKGFANWFRIQVQEELGHAVKMMDYVLERGANVELKAIDGPPTSWESPLAAFQATLKHEREVTGRVNRLVDLAIAESDHATNGFLQWFVTEQVEEEATADELCKQLELMQGAPGGLFMLDRELMQRQAGPLPGSDPVA